MKVSTAMHKFYYCFSKNPLLLVIVYTAFRIFAVKKQIHLLDSYGVQNSLFKDS